MWCKIWLFWWKPNIKKTAKYLADGKTIGWFKGKMNLAQGQEVINSWSAS